MQKYNTYWIAPVDILSHQDGRLPVEGPLQAVKLMEGDWPEKMSEDYRTALRECDLACRLRGGLGSSRERFVAAALAARVLVPHKALRGGLAHSAAAGSTVTADQYSVLRDGGSLHGVLARESPIPDTSTSA